MNEDLIALPGVADVPMNPSIAIGVLALNMAMKYTDASVIKDGAMYQQRKLEGANIQAIGLSDVFEYAKEIEKHLLDSPNRLSKILGATVIEGAMRDMTFEHYLKSEEYIPLGFMIDEMIKEDAAAICEKTGISEERLEELFTTDCSVTQEEADLFEKHYGLSAELIMQVERHNLDIRNMQAANPDQSE